MTSHTVVFTGSKEEKDKQALDECRFYLGNQFGPKTKLLAENIQHLKKTQAFRTMEFYCGMLGIRGRHPVRAMFKYCMNLDLKK